jgi:hypothetical protein
MIAGMIQLGSLLKPYDLIISRNTSLVGGLNPSEKY